MSTSRSHICGVLAAALLMAAVVAPASAGNKDFTLVRAVPNDVFLCVAERHNPERAFLDEYWDEVFQALRKSGIGDDLLGMLNSLLDANQAAEVQRLKERASQLLAGVDWEQLFGQESLFTERFPAIKVESGDRVPIFMPDMVVMLRGSGDGAAENYQGLVAILDAIVEEINNAAGGQVLTVEKNVHLGAQVASVNFLAAVSGAPRLSLSVALRDDVVIIAVREQLLEDVLALMNGSGSKTALADDARFKGAIAKLPEAEGSLVFFDMQRMMNPLRGFLGSVIGSSVGLGDVYANSGMSAEARKLSSLALIAYQRGDFDEAVAQIQKAHEASPESSTIVYNLACFNALAGNRDEALEWLEKAVDAGFCAPRKISGDSDLDTLRGDPRYEAALAKARERAAEYGADDEVVNSSRSGEAYSLLLQTRQAYEQGDYEQALKLAEQAYALKPDDPRVLYSLACFHTLLGHEAKGLDYLEKAVDGGFYCPRHISKDPDLDSVRDNERYKAALTRARKNAAERATRQVDAWGTLAKGLLGRIADAVSTLDYTAAVQWTDGYSVWTESVAALVPGADKQPIYPVFAKRPSLTEFDRYLPRETVSFGVSGGFNLGELYKFIMDSLNAGGPRGEELLEKWQGLQAQFGVDVEKDVLAWIDGDFVSVTLENGQSVTFVKVSNEELAREKFGAAVEFLTTKLPEMMAEQPGAGMMLGMLTVRTSPAQHKDLEGFENLYIAMSPQPAVWGVADGHLILGTSEDAVAMCLATARGDHPNVRSNERVMSEVIVPDGPFVSVSLTDQRKLGEEIAAAIGVGSMVAGMLGAVTEDQEARMVIGKLSGILAKLTPVVRKINFYKSSAECTTFDGQVWRTRAVTHYVSPAERGGI